MLVLSRKPEPGQNTILIGDQIKVILVRLSGGSIRLGIEAPADMPIVREELKEEQGRIQPAPVSDACERAPG